MAHIDGHPPGAFCWLELMTSDQDAAKTFYSSLFGWSVRDFPMGPNGVYTIFQLEGRDAAAAYTMMADQKAQGIPPNWMLYIATADADETAKKAAANGGTVLGGPFDVFDFGRMAVIRDPQGVVFAAWQPKSNQGIGIAGANGTFCWADLNTSDLDAAAPFYTAVFGWEFEKGQDDSGYLHIKNGGQYIGGAPPSTRRNPNAPPHWLLYYMVDDVDKTAASAQALGGRVFLPPMSIDKVGRLSVVADPQGAAFAIFKAAPRDAH